MRSFLMMLLLIAVDVFAQEDAGAMDVMKYQEQLLGTEAPPLTITDWLQNIPADTNFTGKYKVLEFWATWCLPCLKAVPHMNKLQEKMKGENIVFVSVGYESAEKVKATLEKVSFETIVVSDQTRSIHRGLGIQYKGTTPLPRTVLIDDKNRIIWYGTPKKLTEKMLRRFVKGDKV
ncbi:TlpA family protein disulfide reductase [Terrimonas sp. NA20]|uniref:TlpA family protein disulfide reductase n=1 Tax=Terrimonas ginsenosidimutans TaxID=2908004 RepID=A0ABS9KKU8_9BACT|nr:TlpA disulfide reductase family protein [Terrimonas ginsenosidimutans]MCG2612944.1 TlpA family protein disulfide reductase [Terrimonas ginsenosidimutans]